MVVTLSGFVGRYLYSQIPRGLSAAELTKKELDEKEEAMQKELEEQKRTFGFSVDALYHLPTPQRVASSSMVEALLSMFMLDFKRPFQASLVRLQTAGFGPWLFSFCGLRPTDDQKLERAIRVAGTQAALSKRILFLSRTQQVFNLWHVVHRPFSYAFAILALIHIGIVLYMGYRV